MAVLAADITLALNPGMRGLTAQERQQAIAVYAPADAFYNGALVEEVSGLVSPLGITTGGRFRGVCSKGKTTTASSAHRLTMVCGDVVEGVGGTRGVTVTGVTAASDRGRAVFCSTDNIRDATLVWSAGARLIGEVYRYRASGYADILLYLPAEQDSKLVWLDFGAITMSGIGSYAVTKIPGFRGRLLAIGVTVTTVTTDNDAEGILTPTVNATAVTGTLTTTDTAGATNKFDTVGATYYAAISGAGAVFAQGEEILISGTQTTAYSDGIGVVTALVERYNN